MTKIVLVDHSWSLYRFYFAYGKELSVELEGRTVQTGQMFGFTRMVESFYRMGMDKVVFCCDDMTSDGNDEPGERTAVHATYKAGRESRPEVFVNSAAIEALMGLCPIVRFAKAPGKEADDILAQLALVHKLDHGDEVVVFSGDNDLLQLVPYGVGVSRKLGKGQFEFVSAEYIAEKFDGCPIEHLLRYRCIVGDSSDNIPAVVPRLNREFVKLFVAEWAKGTLAEAFQKFSMFENAQKLWKSRNALLRNIQLMNLVRYAKPENRFQIQEYSPVGDLALAQKYNLNSYQRFLTGCTAK